MPYSLPAYVISFPLAVYQSRNCSAFCPKLGTVIFFNCSHSSWCVMIYCGFHLYLPRTQPSWISFHVPSDHPCGLFYGVFAQVFCSVLLRFLSSSLGAIEVLYILRIQVHDQINDYKFLISICGLPFSFSESSCDDLKFSCFIKSSFRFLLRFRFLLWFCFLNSKKTWPISRAQRYFLVSSSRNFRVFAFTFRPVTYHKICVWCEVWFETFFFHPDIHVFLHN